MDAELKLDGIGISDVFYLLEDIARGSIPFDTVTEVDGQLRVLFFDIPVDVSSCILVDFIDLNSKLKKNFDHCASQFE